MSNQLFRARAENELRKLTIKTQTLEAIYMNNQIFIDNHLQKEKEQLLNNYNLNSNDIAFDPRVEESAIIIALNNYEIVSIESREILSQYLIVACYSFFEKSVKSILELTGEVNSNSLKYIYKKVNLTKELKRLGIDYTQLSEYQNVEELRCLNNSIKHSGVVGKELEQINCYIAIFILQFSYLSPLYAN